MKYHIYQETTNWVGDFPNHVYIFKEKPTGRTAKAIGYVRAGTTQVEMFSKPMVFDLKDRAFKELDR